MDKPAKNKSNPADPVRPFLPYGRQVIDDDDVAAVVAALQSDWLTTGPEVAAFEDALTAATGARHAVACSSGTAALHLTMLAAGIGSGDVVIVPANTFLATANAVRYVGAEIAFADVDAATGLMMADHAQTALDGVRDGPVRAVVPVHFAGQCADPVALKSFADRHDMTVVEDACHAIGTIYEQAGQPLKVGGGAHASMTAFSFHPVKTVAMGEGGAITTGDDELAARLRELRNHGISRDPAGFTNAELALDPGGDPNPWYYEMAAPGFNYRASDLHCALGRSQLAKLDKFVAHRRGLADRYAALLAPLQPIVQPLARASGCEPAWHLQVLRIDFAAAGRSRAEVMRRLAENGIASQVHYMPVPWQPYYRARYGDIDLPGARAHYEQCLSIPLFASMGEDDVARVVDAIADAVGA